MVSCHYNQGDGKRYGIRGVCQADQAYCARGGDTGYGIETELTGFREFLTIRGILRGGVVRPRDFSQSIRSREPQGSP